MSEVWYPEAVLRPLPEAETQGFIVPRLALIHTNGAGEDRHSESLYSWWMNPASKGGESHFQVARDGGLEQYMPVNRQADCNYKANSFLVDGVRYGAISFETEDLGAWTVEDTPLTPAQMSTIARCLAWLHAEHGLSLENPTTWNGQGVGYHTQFPNHWTNVPGKTCPGAAKKAQLPELRALATALVAPGLPQPQPEDDRMAPDLFQVDDWAAYAFDPYTGKVRNVTGPELADTWGLPGVTAITDKRTVAELDAILVESGQARNGYDVA